MVTLDKEVPETLEGATQPGPQFQGTEIEERRRSDHRRRQGKHGTLENWDCQSVFTWARLHHSSMVWEALPYSKITLKS